jgi:hypothetical protein
MLEMDQDGNSSWLCFDISIFVSHDTYAPYDAPKKTIRGGKTCCLFGKGQNLSHKMNDFQKSSLNHSSLNSNLICS